MISNEDFAKNLIKLKNRIPQKPIVYTKEHPKSIGEALDLYSNRRSVHSLEMAVNYFNQQGWPVPLWFNPEKIKVGFTNKLLYRRFHNSWGKKMRFEGFASFEPPTVIVMNHIAYKKNNFDESVVEAFESNYSYLKNKLFNNTLLADKKELVEETLQLYKRKLWIGTICTMFPLLESVTRKLLKTTKLGTDVGKICKLFSANGFPYENVHYLTPHAAVSLRFFKNEKFDRDEFERLINEVKGINYGLIGPALGSFLYFSNHYYGYYRDDLNNVDIINRHAIIHGSVSKYGQEVNVIKLFTFLYLMLELEPVFEILFHDN